MTGPAMWAEVAAAWSSMGALETHEEWLDRVARSEESEKSEHASEDESSTENTRGESGS
jgi:hypothetical protein